MSSILPAASAFQDALDGADARAFSGGDAADVVSVLARTIKIAEAARTRFAHRAAECGAHRDRGFSNPSEWVARETGESAGQARAELELTAHLDENPELRQAVEGGEVSLAEAAEVAKTETECPGSTPDMLQEAKRRGLRGVKQQGRKKRQAAQNPDQLAAKRRRARHLRTWEDDLGMICGQFALEPHLGVPLLKRLDAEINRQFRSGDPDYQAEPRERRAADALTTLLEGKGKPSTTRPELVAVWNLNDDTAQLPGHGPIDHPTLRQIAKDAIVTTVLHDGEKVTHIRRHTRTYPVALRVLLEIGPAPHFDGPVCVDCGRHYHLERDHTDPLTNGGPTTIDNLDWRCPHCHKTKTANDRKAGLLNGNKRRNRRKQPADRAEQPTLTDTRAPP